MKGKIKKFLFGLIEKITGMVRVKDITKIRVLGTVYPLVGSTSSGHGDYYKTVYTIKKTRVVNEEAARDYDEYVDIESRDVQEFISEYMWVPNDSLLGILSKVTFDEKLIKEWKNEKSTFVEK